MPNLRARAIEAKFRGNNRTYQLRNEYLGTPMQDRGFQTSSGQNQTTLIHESLAWQIVTNGAI